MCDIEMMSEKKIKDVAAFILFEALAGYITAHTWLLVWAFECDRLCVFTDILFRSGRSEELSDMGYIPGVSMDGRNPVSFRIRFDR